jgi:hypothetical protein
MNYPALVVRFSISSKLSEKQDAGQQFRTQPLLPY